LHSYRFSEKFGFSWELLENYGQAWEQSRDILGKNHTSSPLLASKTLATQRESDAKNYAHF